MQVTWFSAVTQKVKLLSRKEGSMCDVFLDMIQLEHVSDLKYFGCVLDESGSKWRRMSKEGVECKESCVCYLISSG